MAASGSGQGLMASTRLPLNSRRMTVDHLCWLVSEFDVPTSASSNELCQMINGKLEEQGKDIMNVQVVLVSTETGSEFCGKFLNVLVFI